MPRSRSHDTAPALSTCRIQGRGKNTAANGTNTARKGTNQVRKGTNTERNGTNTARKGTSTASKRTNNERTGARPTPCGVRHFSVVLGGFGATGVAEGICAAATCTLAMRRGAGGWEQTIHAKAMAAVGCVRLMPSGRNMHSSESGLAPSSTRVPERSPHRCCAFACLRGHVRLRTHVCGCASLACARARAPYAQVPLRERGCSTAPCCTLADVAARSGNVHPAEGVSPDQGQMWQG